MLKPAQLYKDKIQKLQWDIAYDLDYQYFNSDTGNFIYEFSNTNQDHHHFVSVDENDNVLGVISYGIYHLAKSADNFGFISFDRGNLIFIRDACQAVYDIFFKYGLERMGFHCFADNPAMRGYRKFIEKCGGRECGYKRNYIMLMDHKIHDQVEFEILKDELDPTYMLRILKRGK